MVKRDRGREAERQSKLLRGNIRDKDATNVVDDVARAERAKRQSR